MIVDLSGGDRLVISSASGLGQTREIAERVSRIVKAPTAHEKVRLVAPFRESMRDQARVLIEQGPPFDLTQTTLASHEVFLTAHEAVFVFDGASAKDPVEQLIGEPGVWRGAAGWTECFAGRPRIAQEKFSWIRPDDTDRPARVVEAGSVNLPGDRRWRSPPFARRDGHRTESELSLDAVLQRLVEAAAAITGAQYAALGVIDRAGRGLEQFRTKGVSQELIEEIGDLPVGRGILGVLIKEAKPLRLHDLSEHHARSAFPPNHPPMRTFLGVPVALRGVAYGNLYLTEKEGGQDFSEDDEEPVQLLAAQAAVAIENARLYESARRWSRQLESMTEVGNAIAQRPTFPPCSS